MSTPFRLLVPADLVREMIAQARSEAPLECCGLLAGPPALPDQGREGGVPRVGKVVRRYPLINGMQSPTRFLSDGRSMFAAVRDMRQQHIDILAVYHSHPTSDPIPSRTDLEHNYSPDVMNLIISLKCEEPVVRAWWLTDRDYTPGDWDVLDPAN